MAETNCCPLPVVEASSEASTRSEMIFQAHLRLAEVVRKPVSASSIALLAIMECLIGSEISQ